MSTRLPTGLSVTRTIDPWLLWILFFSAILVFVSLWIITIPEYHFVISLFTIVTLWIWSPSPHKTLMSILILVAFLALLQILFSPFMRNMFFASSKNGFRWADWQYLLFAVERFAWPLAIVSTFKNRLSSPKIIAQLTFLLLPFKWLGLKIEKLQVLLLLTLRFMPSLFQEWDRFTHLQTYFLARLPQKTLIQKLKFWQGVLKAMVAHTIHRAVSLGDLLALRGLPDRQLHRTSKNVLLPGLIWFLVGLLFFVLNTMVFIFWLGLSAWLVLVALVVDWERTT